MAALVVLAALATGAGSATSATLPAAEELPRNVVAFVSHLPVGYGRITRVEFQRALAQGAAAAGRASVPEPGGRGYDELRDDALGELLDAAWIRGQAAEMGVAVITRDQVATELAQIKKESFESEAEYRKFLRHTRFTQRDVDERIELQLLSVRIQKRVARGASGARDAQKKFTKFVNLYSKRWRARTVCAAEFAIERCSNGPPPS